MQNVIFKYCENLIVFFLDISKSLFPYFVLFAASATNTEIAKSNGERTNIK